MIRGPEKATLIERLAGIFHLPYVIGCLIISLFASPPGAIILAYISTTDLQKAVSMAINLFAGANLPFFTGIAFSAILWLFVFYVFYMTRFMRQRLLLTEKELHPVLPEGEQTFHGAFKWVSKLWPPVITAVAMIGVYFALEGEALLEVFRAFAIQIINLIYIVIAYPIWFLAFCTFAWVYFGSIYGLYKLGKKPLNLKSSAEDRMLGVKPFGNLSLSLSIVYFFAMLILIMFVICEAIGSSANVGTSFVILLITFSIVGVVLFIAPLYTVHNRMMEQKEKERIQLRQKAYKGVEEAQPGAQDTVAEVKRKLESLTTMMHLDMAEKSLNAVPNWPIDTPIMRQFVTIIFSVVAILMAQLILQLLRS